MDVNKDLAAIAEHAEMDQAVEGMANIARLSWRFFSELRSQGFKDAQAFEMTKQWQLVLLTSGFNQGKQSGGQ